MNKKAQSSLVAGFIAILIAVIVAVGVAIPVVTETISEANLTGTTKTIVEYLPMMLAVVLFVAVAGMIYMGRR